MTLIVVIVLVIAMAIAMHILSAFLHFHLHFTRLCITTEEMSLGDPKPGLNPRLQTLEPWTLCPTSPSSQSKKLYWG